MENVCWRKYAKDLLGAPGGAALDKIQAGQFAKDGASELPVLKPGEGEPCMSSIVRLAQILRVLKSVATPAGIGSKVPPITLRICPILWEPSKKFTGLEEMRLDLAKFFSLRSSAGQGREVLIWING